MRMITRFAQAGLSNTLTLVTPGQFSSLLDSLDLLAAGGSTALSVLGLPVFFIWRLR